MKPISWETLQTLARSHGLSAIGVSDTDLAQASEVLKRWLAAGCHGDMDYMLRHSELRTDPSRIVPGCIRAITVRMDYLPAQMSTHSPVQLPVQSPADPSNSPHGADQPDWRSRAWGDIETPSVGYISLYARGRDYHKVLRQRLQAMTESLQALMGPMGHRVFVDSGPVLEVSLASKAGLGWRGKHTLLLNREAGSMFFLGEILTDHPFDLTATTPNHCGSCTACIDVCPTQAIRDGWVDARRCISYLTIEHKGPIPLAFRPAMGNRIYGCDDCQLVCPWNKFARTSPLPDFAHRSALSPQPLAQFMSWTEAEFLHNTAGSAIRRIGHERWQRNVAVAIGNAPACEENRQALERARLSASELVVEHIDWALQRLDAGT